MLLFKPDKLCVAHELHKNGDNHLHVYMQLPTVLIANNNTFTDLIDGPTIYHGNYQSCRSNKNVLKYCTKEDDFLCNFDVDDALSKNLLCKRKLGELLVHGGKTPRELVEMYPELIFGYKKMCLDYS